MSLLEVIKTIGENCPVCNKSISFYVNITQNKNSYHHKLTNREYPLVFTKTHAITLETTSIIINNKDNIIFPNDKISYISINANCSSRHYNVDIYTAGLHKVSSLDLNGINYKLITERAFVKGYDIENQRETYIYILKDSKVYNIPHRTCILRIQRKPISYWHLYDIELFKEKINKLMLLQ